MKEDKMIVAAARALSACYGDPDWRNHLIGARAAIRSIRNPSSEILAAALPDIPDWGNFPETFARVVYFIAEQSA